jgi:hypothetical protein
MGQHKQIAVLGRIHADCPAMIPPIPPPTGGFSLLAIARMLLILRAMAVDSCFPSPRPACFPSSWPPS